MLVGRQIGRALLAGITAAMVAAAGGSNDTGTASPNPVDVGSGSLTGAGATFPAPFYQKAFFDDNAKYPNVTVNYQSVGSGAGISQFQKGTVDFGASDVPMGDADIAKVIGGAAALTQIPTTLGVISIAYNLSGVKKLQLDGSTLANIFLGHITKWNDAAIAAQNSGVTLPSSAIQVVHRSDSSGTSYHVTDYLGKVSSEWKSNVGVAKAVKWPAGIGPRGNQGVAQQITSTAAALGYVELAYVVQTGMSQAYNKNSAGNYLQARVAAATPTPAANNALRPPHPPENQQPRKHHEPNTGLSRV